MELPKVLAGILFVLLPFTGFYLGMKYQLSLSPKANEDITNVATTPVKTPPSTDPTAGWKTYTNDMYNFSFKYPEYLSLEDSPILDDKKEFSLFIKDVQSLNDFDKYFSFDLSIFDNTKYIMGTPYKKELLEFGLEMACPYNIQQSNQSGVTQNECMETNEDKFTQTSIGNINAISGDLLPFESYTHVILFEKEDKVYEISLWGLEGTEPSQYARKTLSQILSTFRFTE